MEIKSIAKKVHANAKAQNADTTVNQFPFTFLQRLAAFMQLGIDLIVVLDGARRPEFKRNKVRTQSVAHEDVIVCRLCEYCGIPVVRAAGEGEAECSLLQLQGLADYVFSEDSDTLLFGARKVMMYASTSSKAAGTGAVDRPVRIFDVDEYEEHLIQRGLVEEDGRVHFRERCILRALIQGGDYSKGVLRLGTVVAQEACHPQTGFTKQLADSFRWAGSAGRDSPMLFTEDQEHIYQEKIQQWRQRLLHDLTTNESKFFSTKHNISPKALAEFPSIEILQNYFFPVVASHQPTLSDMPNVPQFDRLKTYLGELSGTDVLYQLINWMLLPMLVVNIRRKCDKKQWYESVSEKNTGKHLSRILKVKLSLSSFSDILRTKEPFTISRDTTKELLGYILDESVHTIAISAPKKEVYTPPLSSRPIKRAAKKHSNAKPDRRISEFFKAAKKSGSDTNSPKLTEGASLSPEYSEILASPKRPLVDPPSPPDSAKKTKL